MHVHVKALISQPCRRHSILSVEFSGSFVKSRMSCRVQRVWRNCLENLGAPAAPPKWKDECKLPGANLPCLGHSRGWDCEQLAIVGREQLHILVLTVVFSSYFFSSWHALILQAATAVIALTRAPERCPQFERLSPPADHRSQIFPLAAIVSEIAGKRM